jgi:holo-[acyl-carrier protein] synthase
MSIRIGIDLVNVNDVREAIAEHGERYLERVYTADELQDCTRDSEPDPGRLAARFAAKEATMKVLRCGDEALPWSSIALRKRPGGWPDLELAGEAKRLAQSAGVGELTVSITHEADYAAAVVAAATAS